MQHFLPMNAFYRSFFLVLLLASSQVIAQNVGINAPTPLSPLHVRGNDVILTIQEIAANNAGTGALIAFEGQTEANVPKSAYIGIVPSDNIFSHRNGSLEIRMTDRINFFRSVNNVSSSNMAMTIIGSTGNVGIGITTPNAALQLGNVMNNRRLVLWQDANNDHQFNGFGITTAVLRYQVAQSTSSHVFYSGAGTAASTELMRIQGNGNVGIGVPNATEKLHVGGNIRVANDGNIFGLDQLVGFNDLKLSGDAANGPDMIISANGRVGINTIAFDETSLDLKARTDDIYIMYLRDNNNAFRFGVYKSGHVSINQAFSNVTLNVKATEVAQRVFNVVNAAGNTSLFNVNEAGAVNVTGVLTKGGGSFKIDHPLDPENKYLYHSFVESPDMMNVYNGNITTNANGEAVIEMPEWFDALNKDFRYQLTTIGQPAQAWIEKELAGNSFALKTDKPNVKVSWQITGIRKDAWANKNRIPVEEMKQAQERGKYQHPESFGKPAQMGIQPGNGTSAEMGVKQ